MTLRKEEPLYKRIIDYLKQRIEDGEFLSDQQLPTEYELTEMFRVSRITSRRALEELKREGLIYRKRGGGSFISPSAFAEKDSEGEKSNGISNKPDIISLILPCKTSIGKLEDYIRGATAYLSDKGYFLTVHDSQLCIDNEKNIICDLVSNGVKGIIFYPFSDMKNLQILYDLYIKKFPIVTIDKYFEAIPLSYVVSDNFDGGYKMTKYLIELGHKNIAYVSASSIEHATSSRNRYFGYCRALADIGIQVNTDILLLGYNNKLTDWVTTIQKDINIDELPFEQAYKYHIQFSQNFIESILDKGVTAIQTDDDYVGVQLLKACIQLGVKVPDELSITGFDNINISMHCEVPITTVEQDSYAIGKTAAELVVKSIEENYNEYTKIFQPVKLITRQSTGIIAKNVRKIG